MTQKRFKEAEDSFLWLRGRSHEALTELEGLMRKEKEDESSSITGKDSSDFAKLRKNAVKPEFYKPLLIILFFFFVMQFSGVNSVAFYTVSLMTSITGTGREYFSMILIDTVRVFASFLGCVVLKLCYRRTLIVVSGIGTSLCMITVSTLMYLTQKYPDSDFSWFTLAFIIGYITFISAGIFPLPWVLQGEMLQQVTRGFSSGFTASFNFVCFFIVVKTFVGLQDSLETFGVFLCYGLISLIGTLILFLIVPETKNKTLQQIEDEFK